MNIDHKHTWVLDREALYVRFYLWLYSADEHEANFCKMWWGYVFAPIMLPLRLLGILVRPLALRLDHKLMKRSAERRQAELRESTARIARRRAGEPEPVKKPSRPMVFITKVGEIVSRIVMAMSSAWHWATSNKKFNHLVGRALLALAALIALAGAVGLVYVIVVNIDVTLIVVAILASLLVAGAALVGLKLVGAFDVVGDNVLAPVGRGTLGFFGMLKQGFIAVKSNTCPEVIIK